MTKEPDVKKLAEFAGFTALCDREDGTKYIVMWEYPDGEFNLEPPDFPHDETACFKWLVPKLYELGWSYELKGYTYHTVTLRNNEIQVNSKGYKDPALALCKAIEKLIDELP